MIRWNGIWVLPLQTAPCIKCHILQYADTLFAYAACPIGTYRSLDISTCMSCPDSSTSEAASSYCQCIEGNYRALDLSNTIHSSCTSMFPPFKILGMSLFTLYSSRVVGPPSAPRSLSIEASTNVSCTVRWKEPSDNGGRSDTFYSITYKEEGSISGSSDPITTSNMNYIIANLKPVTVYQISVTAENGVSHNEVSLDHLHQRTATVICATKEGGVYLYACTLFRMIDLNITYSSRETF